MRLRGRLSRHGFEVRSYDLGEARATADFAPVYRASEQVPSTRMRELVRSALEPRARRARPAAGRARAADPARRARGGPLPRRPGGGRAGPAAARARRARRAPARRPALARRERAGQRRCRRPGELVARYRAVLPFALTEHQEPAIAEIDRDLARDVPMQRLLQGDVGSGKTVVALYALLRAVEAGRQGALMAPTETLAEQHFLTIEGICAELGVRVVLLTGSAGSAKARAAIASGEARDRGRHARADPARRRVRRSRGRGRRRAAPLRRRAAPGARRRCARTCST